VILLCAGISSAQDIYVYPNKRLADQGLIEYRRYTLEEARAYQQGSLFEPYLTTGWSAERRITEDSNVYSPKAITMGDSIYCTYSILSPHELYFISSYDAGQTWNQKIFLGDTNGINAHEFPELAKNGSKLIIGCSIYNYTGHGYNLAYFKSPNGGISWDTLRTVFSYYRFNSAQFASLCNNVNTVYMSYAEFDHDSIYVLRSVDWGAHWNGRGINVATANTGMIQPMVLRASGSTLHLVWVADLWPVAVHYSRSTDNGQTWSPEIDIAQDSLGAQLCYISVQGQHVAVSWMGYKNSPYMFTGDLFIRQSNDGGVTWDSAQVLTDLHKVMFSNVYLKDSLLVAAWMDARYGNGNDEVMVRYSTDYGTIWSEETRLSYGDYHSDSPVSFSTGNRIHVLWGDRRETSPGLYYSYNDLGTGIDTPQIPINHSVLSAYPNPFNSSIVFTYPAVVAGRIRIFNLAGQLVRTLNTNGKEVKVIWDGTDDNGQPLSSGIYFAVVSTSAGLKQTKVTFLK
jgi:hypothetical protein